MAKLSTFIRDNMGEILAQWETFARALPEGGSMDVAALRDHAQEMLDGITIDLERPKTEREHAEESKGQTGASGKSSDAAQGHGAARAKRGFTIAEMVAEFRALRVTVTRLWIKHERELVATDVDELTKFNEAIDQAIAESITRYIRELNQSRDRFLAILGHDLRTPLSAILMSASFMLETGELPDPTRDRVSIIASGAKRMNQMVADLLDFARVQFGGRMPITRSEMDARKLLDTVASEVALSHPKSQLHIESTGDLRGEWDHDRLAQALTNLVTNAVQHGAGDKPINLVARGELKEVVISVQNHGPPIPPDKLSQVFAGTRQDEHDTAHRAGHLGLGLYIVHAIVRAHGGTIDASSSEEAGTTFTLHLPRNPLPH